MPSFTTKTGLRFLSMKEKQLKLQLNLHFYCYVWHLYILELLSDSKCCLILVIRCLQVSPLYVALHPLHTKL